MSGPSFTWERVGQSVWRHNLPDGRKVIVLLYEGPTGSTRWLWQVTEGDGVAELNGWCKGFDAAKLRGILAWKDTARQEHKAAYTVDAVQSLTRSEAT